MPQPYAIQINVDCRDAHAQADWWAETLGWMVEPTDPDFIQRIDEGYATEATSSCTAAHGCGVVPRSCVRPLSVPSRRVGGSCSRRSPRPRRSRTVCTSTLPPAVRTSTAA